MYKQGKREKTVNHVSPLVVGVGRSDNVGHSHRPHHVYTNYTYHGSYIHAYKKQVYRM